MLEKTHAFLDNPESNSQMHRAPTCNDFENNFRRLTNSAVFVNGYFLFNNLVCGRFYSGNVYDNSMWMNESYSVLPETIVLIKESPFGCRNGLTLLGIDKIMFAVEVIKQHNKEAYNITRPVIPCEQLYFLQFFESFTPQNIVTN